MASQKLPDPLVEIAYRGQNLLVPTKRSAQSSKKKRKRSVPPVIRLDTVLPKEHSATNLENFSSDETPVRSHKHIRTKPPKKKLNRIRLTPKILRFSVETLYESDSEDENVSEISSDDSVSVNNTRLSSTDESEDEQ